MKKNVKGDSVDYQAKLQETEEQLKKVTEFATFSSTALQNAVNAMVPKQKLAEESFIEKVRIYLSGKGSWVKALVGVALTLLGTFVGFGVQEVLDIISQGAGLADAIEEILVGLVIGGGFSIGVTGQVPDKVKASEIAVMNDGTVKYFKGGIPEELTKPPVEQKQEEKPANEDNAGDSA